jgi:hypothetical protein
MSLAFQFLYSPFSETFVSGNFHSLLDSKEQSNLRECSRAHLSGNAENDQRKVR